MSHCISLKEAQRQLTRAACSFASITRACLELWLQAAGDCPSMQQYIQTAPVMDLVGAALQQWPGRQGEERQLAWMQQHLPGISTAMHDCLCNLINISIKRAHVLQSLIISKQRFAEMLALMKAEGKVCLYLEVLAPIFLVVLPVAALVEELSHCNRLQQRSAHVQYGHQQHRLRQGNNLISRVGSSLAQRAHIPAELHRKVKQIRVDLNEVGIQPKEDETIVDYTVDGLHATAFAGMQWLRMTALLPLHHPNMPDFLGHIDWHMLCAKFLRPTEVAATRFVVSLAVTQPKLLSEMRKRLHPKPVGELLIDFDVTPEYLQGLGHDHMPPAHMKIVLSLLQDPRPHVGPCIEANCTSSDSSSDSKGGVVNDSSKSVASDDTESFVAVEVDDGLMDMTGLLHMMYGMDIALDCHTQAS